MRLPLMCFAAVLVIGCDQARNDNLFRYEDLFYNPRITVDAEDKSRFSVRVPGFEQGLPGAREAGRYEAIKHCINYLGSSDIAWDIGPDDDKDSLQIVDGALVFTGQCGR